MAKLPSLPPHSNAYSSLHATLSQISQGHHRHSHAASCRHEIPPPPPPPSNPGGQETIQSPARPPVSGDQIHACVCLPEDREPESGRARGNGQEQQHSVDDRHRHGDTETAARLGIIEDVKAGGSQYAVDQVSNSSGSSRKTVDTALASTASLSDDAKTEEDELETDGLKDGSHGISHHKRAWLKLEADSMASVEPEFVMETASWPTLAEARNAKPGDGRKHSTGDEADSLQTQLPNKGSSLRNLDSKFISGSKQKSAYKREVVASENLPLHGQNNKNSTRLPFQNRNNSRNGAPPAAHRQILRPKCFPVAQFQPPVHSPMQFIPNNSAIWHYGAQPAYYIQPEQHIDPRNLQALPFMPVMNVPAFYGTPANYQKSNVYVPAALDLCSKAVCFQPQRPPAATVFQSHDSSLMSQGPILQSRNTASVQSLLQKQIEYYFSTENLCKDMYLRSKMDDQGFVPVSLIASFNRVQKLSTNPALILSALQNSSVVEVNGGMLRKSRDWEKWLLPNLNLSENSRVSCRDNPGHLERGTNSTEHCLHRSTVSVDGNNRNNVQCNGRPSCASGSNVHNHDEPLSASESNTVRVCECFESQKKGHSKNSDVSLEDMQHDFQNIRIPFLVNDQKCHSFTDSANLSKSLGNKDEGMEANNRSVVAHGQLSSCIAVP